MKDENEDSATELIDYTKYQISAEIPGPPDDTPVSINIYEQINGGKKKLWESRTVPLKDSKIQEVWYPNLSVPKSKLKSEGECIREGKEFSPPKYWYEIECLGGKVKSEEINLIASPNLCLDFIEISEFHFNLNSGIPCLDSFGCLISSFTQAFAYANENTDKELIIFGHTDTSGEKELNYELSEIRAKAVQAVLNQDKDTWIEIAKNRSKVEDYQQILDNLSVCYGWNCSPGKIDNIDGPKTEAAVLNFQKQANHQYSYGLKEDGAIGPKTWEAIFGVYLELVKLQLQVDSLPTITYGYADGEGVFACGESFNIEAKNIDNYQSKRNRRVELVFSFVDEIKLEAASDLAQNLTAEQCPVYGPDTVRKPIRVKPPIPPEFEFEYEYPMARLKEILEGIEDDICVYWFGGIYGRHLKNESYLSLRDQILSDDLELCDCQILPASSPLLNGSLGVYDEYIRRIYLSRKLFVPNEDSSLLAAVVCEEFGHHLENILRDISGERFEAPKDEGACFARYILEDEVLKDENILIGKIKDSQDEFYMDPKELSPVLERQLNHSAIEWDHTLRQYSFSSSYLSVDDIVEEEMPGVSLKLTQDLGSLKKGDQVTVKTWTKNSTSVSVTTAAGATQNIDVENLTVNKVKSKLIYYNVGLDSQLSAVLKNKKKVDDWLAKESAYSKNKSLWEKERDRFQDSLKKRQVVYGNMIAREYMYNRFDLEIIKWTDHYNKRNKPKVNLNADIVKSMAFQEGRMGTSGSFYRFPPYHWEFWESSSPYVASVIMSRFNLIQALDSAPQQQYLMIEEIDEAFFKTEKFDGRTMEDLKVRAVWKGLSLSNDLDVTTPVPTYTPDLKLMRDAMKKFAETQAAPRVLASPDMGVYTDYNYNIRCAVCWLMYKYTNTAKSASWELGVKRYNGNGPDAENYSKTVFKRVADAKNGELLVGNK